MNYILERSSEDIKSEGGLSLIGRIMERSGFSDAFANRRVANILMTETALLCQGRTDFNDVELFRGDAFFAEAIGLNRVPSEPTLRQGLDACDGSTQADIRKVNLSVLNAATFTPEETTYGKYIPVDIDVSPFDNSGSKKEGVSYTY